MHKSLKAINDPEERKRKRRQRKDVLRSKGTARRKSGDERDYTRNEKRNWIWKIKGKQAHVLFVPTQRKRISYYWNFRKRN
jgi:hypothetical protein